MEYDVIIDSKNGADDSSNSCGIKKVNYSKIFSDLMGNL